MAKIIKAEVQTNSADDRMGRVKLRSDGIWNQDTELVQSVNGCPLSKGDIVFVSVSDGYYNPLILGKADRNDIVLNLLVSRMNESENKINEVVNMLNKVITILATTPTLAVLGQAPLWLGEGFFSPLMNSLQTLPKNTNLKDIQDNYK